jgi:hypothetical protein
MERVRVPRMSVEFPGVCACCLTPTDASLRIQRRKTGTALVIIWEITSSLTVPYCPACQKHAIWYQEAGWLGVVSRAVAWGILLAAVGAAAGFIAPLPGVTAWPIIAAAFAGGAAGAVTVSRRVRYQPSVAPDGAHASRGPAIYLHDVRDGTVAVDVYSSEFARRIAAGNPGSQLQALRPPSALSWELLQPLVVAVMLIAIAVVAYLGARNEN